MPPTTPPSRRRLAARLVAVATLLLAFLVDCEAGTKWQKQEQRKPDRLTCYQCNSLYDERCADPFALYSLAQGECNLKSPPAHLNSTLRPILCRKITQRVQGKIRVIRGCGYLPDEKHGNDCFFRTGTHEVHITYCACNTSFCNGAWGAPTPSPPHGVLLGSFGTVLLAPLINFLHLGGIGGGGGDDN